MGALRGGEFRAIAKGGDTDQITAVASANVAWRLPTRTTTRV